MGWAVKLGDVEQPLGALSPAAFQAICDRHGLAWRTLYGFPATKPDAMYELIELVAAQAHAVDGVPGRPTTVGDARKLANCFVRCAGVEIPTTKGSSPWAIEIDGKPYRIEDLPIDALDEIAQAARTSWLQLSDFPMVDLVAFGRLVALTAEHHGLDARTQPATVDEAIASMAMLVAVDDDLPSDWDDDGNPPAGEPTTT